MPYTVENPPEQIKGQPKHLIEIWVAAFNSAMDQYDGDEQKSMATAWAAVKTKFNKNEKTGMWEPKAEMHKAILTLDALGEVPEWIRILPAGTVPLTDSRPPFLVDKKGMAAVIEAFTKRGNDLVIDYEHQTNSTMDNGRPAPAAGWIKTLEARSDGIWAKVEWTEAAQEFISKKEYRYFSPVITLEPKTRRVEELFHAALTNFPAISNLTPLSARYGADLEVLTLANEQMKKAQLARAKKCGISAKSDGNIAKPEEFSSVPDNSFADPTNYRYPLHDYNHVKTAWGSWNQADNQVQYSSEERTKITNRITSRAKAVGMKIAEENTEVFQMLEKLRKLLGLEEDADETAVILKVQEINTAAGQLTASEKDAEQLRTDLAAEKTKVRETETRAMQMELKANSVKVPLTITECVGLPHDAPAEKVIGRIEAYKGEVETGKAAQTELAALKESVLENDSNVLIQEALKTGRTSPEELSRGNNRLQLLAKEDAKFFRDLVMTRPVGSVVPLDKLNLSDKNKGGETLTTPAKKMAAAFGLTPEAFKASADQLDQRNQEAMS
jgi:phage I-like protein/cation transport regulator ChaB